MPLAVVQAPTCSHSSFYPVSSYRDNIMDHSIFGSLKSKLTRKISEKTSAEPKKSTHIPRQSSNPFLQTMAPTRRPGKSREPDQTILAADVSLDRSGMNAFTTASNGPPPAYTPSAPVVAPATAGASCDNDPYAFLTSFDTIFVVDDSGSMVGRSWRETAKALEAITPICTAHDADGIDLYFLNAPDSEWYHNITTVSTVTEIFTAVQPRG